MDFAKEIPDFKQREEESRSLLKQYPNKLPTVIEPLRSGQNAYTLDQNK